MAFYTPSSFPQAPQSPKGRWRRELREGGKISSAGVPPPGKRKPSKISFSPNAYTYQVYCRPCHDLLQELPNTHYYVLLAGLPICHLQLCHLLYFFLKKTLSCLTALGIPSFLPRPPEGVKAYNQCSSPTPRVMALHGALGREHSAEKLEESGRRPVAPPCTAGQHSHIH